MPGLRWSLFAFRERFIAANLDRRLLERTLELAPGIKAFTRELRETCV